LTFVSKPKFGTWLFLGSEAMFFGSLFSAYVMLRAGSTEWPASGMAFPWLETVLLISASAVFGPSRFRLIGAHALSVAFVVIKVVSDLVLINTAGVTPATNLMWACWFAITWVHAAHVLGGAIWTGWIAGPAYRLAEFESERFLERVAVTRRYWLFVDLVWLFIVIGFL